MIDEHSNYCFVLTERWISIRADCNKRHAPRHFPSYSESTCFNNERPATDEIQVCFLRIVVVRPHATHRCRHCLAMIGVRRSTFPYNERVEQRVTAAGLELQHTVLVPSELSGCARARPVCCQGEARVREPHSKRRVVASVAHNVLCPHKSIPIPMR